MKTYKIHLIRHGMTQANIDGIYAGHTNVPVCEQGKKQLIEMVRDFEYPTPQALFCSPMDRCIETAKIIYPDMKPIIINDLMEYDFGEFEGRSPEELQDRDVFKNWVAGDGDAAPPFGESNRHFGKRVCTAFTKIVDGLIKTGTTSASIVAHGGVIMAILSCFGIPELPMTQWLAPNGCGYTISINPSLWSRIGKFEVIADIPYSDGEPEADYGYDVYKADLNREDKPEKARSFFDTLHVDD